MYNKVKDTENNNYTEESWTNFKNELKNAKAVLDKEGSTQEEIDEANNRLSKAVANLKKETSKSKVKNQERYQRVKIIPRLLILVIIQM